jgi:hypothetical protein
MSPFIEKAPNHPCFDLPDIQEPPLVSLDVLPRNRRTFEDVLIPLRGQTWHSRCWRCGRRNDKSSDGGTRNGVDEKASCGVSLLVKRTSPFIGKAPNHPYFDLPDIQGPPPGISRRPPTKPPHVRGRAYPAPRADVAV